MSDEIASDTIIKTINVFAWILIIILSLLAIPTAFIIGGLGCKENDNECEKTLNNWKAFRDGTGYSALGLLVLVILINLPRNRT